MLVRLAFAGLALVGCWDPTGTGGSDAGSTAGPVDVGAPSDQELARRDASVDGRDVDAAAPHDAHVAPPDAGLLQDAVRPIGDVVSPTPDIGPPADAKPPPIDASLPPTDGAGNPPDAHVVPPEIPAGYVRIEAGVFMMGSPAGPEPPAEPGRRANEVQHQVTLTHAFLLKETEVTQWEWENQMGDRPFGFPDCGPTCPVDMAAWFDAVAYCNALSRAEGLARCYEGAGGADYDRIDAMDELIPVWRDGLDCTGYRLPTEEEWEYAARAGTTEASHAGPVGDVDCELDPTLENIAWYCGNSNITPHPVGGKAANAWGLYDMLGNVWEWNWDWHGEYPNGPGQDYLGAPGGGLRVERGGSYGSVSRFLRSALRRGTEPGYVRPSAGFRPARTL